MRRLPSKVIAALGVAQGCRLFGPCLSVQACLAPIVDTGCDTGDTGDTGCDTGDESDVDDTGEGDRQERARALDAAGVLPPGVADRLAPK